MDAQATFTNTQLTIGLLLGVVSLLGVGITVGRVLERIRNAESRVDKSLEAFQATLTKVVTDLTNQLREVHEQGSLVLRTEWSQWRTGVERDIGAIQHDLGNKGESIHKIRGKMQAFELNQTRIADKLDIDLNEG